MALTMMPTREKVPSHGLEVILGMLPLDLKIKEQALKSGLRVLPNTQSNWTGFGPLSSGHRKWIRDELINIGITETSFDIDNALNLNPKYRIDTDSYESGTPVQDSTVKCFTDGSKISNSSSLGKTGFGVAIADGLYIISSENGSLDCKNSVFQAETVAIQQACSHIDRLNLTSATIYVDSRAAISALAALRIKSKTVSNCVLALNKVSDNCAITIRWIRAHQGHCGNEYVDSLAKVGTENTNNKLTVLPPISWANLLITQAALKAWNNRWKNYPHCRQTKIWFPKIDLAKSKLLIRSNRTNLGLAIAMITGHNRLKRHEAIVSRDEIDSLCRMCGEEDESSFHIIGECPALWKIRADIFQELRSLSNPPKWEVPQFMKFLKMSGISELNKGEDHLPL